MIDVLYLYIFMLAAFVGYEVISRVPVILHTPLMSGSNFIHGVVLVGAMYALGHAETPLQIVLGFLAVLLGAANAAGDRQVACRHLWSSAASPRPEAAAVSAGCPRGRPCWPDAARDRAASRACRTRRRA